MRTSFILLLFTAISSFSYSQEDYYPMIREGFEWEVHNTDVTSPCVTTGGASYFFGQDTIISDTVYTKVMGIPLVSLDQLDCPPYYKDTTSIFRANFLLREEVENKRVFIRWDFVSETLLYDFGLEVGDTLFIDPNSGDYFEYGAFHVVTSVDAVSLNNGEMRRNLNYENWQGTIESIGPTNGIQHGGIEYLSGLGTILGCAKENGEVLWSDFGGCSGILSTSEAEGKNSLSLFPNPATKEIWLELEHSRGTYTYQVLDVSGKSWAEGQIIQANKSLDISNLPVGVYMIQLSNGQGISAAKKFVKTSD